MTMETVVVSRTDDLGKEIYQHFILFSKQVIFLICIVLMIERTILRNILFFKNLILLCIYLARFSILPV